MKSTILDRLHLWSAWQPDKRLDFNGFFLPGLAGGVLVDPMPLDAAALGHVREHGGAAHVLVTNADHWRATSEVRGKLQVRVLAHAAERERLGARGGEVDHWLAAPGDLPEALRAGLELFELRGGKSPVELALHLKPQRALLFGDLVRSHSSGALTMLPAGKLADRAAALNGLRPLLAKAFDAVLVGDGDCLLRDGREALYSMLDGLDGALFNRLNLDQLRYETVSRHPRSVSEVAQLSRAMTCRRLGFHARRLPPGMTWPAYHHETLEEEVFLVRHGKMTVRTPQGTFTLEPGDLIALPATPAGAHQFRNDFDEPCEFLALSNLEPANVSVYPEGKRIAVGLRGEVYRIGDQRRDYWEDEPSIRD